MPRVADIVVVGGGISGVSIAARLAPHASVLVLEAEDHLGTHATARSAALLVEAYGPPQIRRLTGMSRRFFEQPEGFSEVPLARRRGGLIYAPEGQTDRLRAEFEKALRSAPVVWLDGNAVEKACPLLKPGLAAAGFLEPAVLDLDTNALLQGFARAAREAGAEIVTGAPVSRMQPTADGWRIEARGTQFSCGIIVNAAGAWADRVAESAGVRPRGLRPMRRTAATINVPPDIEALLPRMPFAAPVDESFYFKPEAGAILVSLSEETPSDPCDAYPDDLDVATALERFHDATIVPRGRPAATWAGLRTFVGDRLPVVGFDPQAPRFFWYAAQGGYGIQTSPALSTLGAKLITGEELEPLEVDLAAALRCGR
jgi:D-arginine dehydrogenase